MPTPVTTAGQTVITAQFKQSTAAGQAAVAAGAPSGTVAFTAAGAALPATKLILDKTATFTPQVTVVSTSTTATPTITPAAGSYVNSTTITITDSTPGAAIYYTQDGSAPTTASTVYTGPFNIATSQTITAIAAASGYLNSAAASAAYVVTLSPPTQLAFLVQPSNTGTGAAITPAVQVAIEDANGNTVTSATSAVTLCSLGQSRQRHSPGNHHGECGERSGDLLRLEYRGDRKRIYVDCHQRHAYSRDQRRLQHHSDPDHCDRSKRPDRNWIDLDWKFHVGPAGACPERSGGHAGQFGACECDDRACDGDCARRSDHWRIHLYRSCCGQLDSYGERAELSHRDSAGDWHRRAGEPRHDSGGSAGPNDEFGPQPA